MTTGRPRRCAGPVGHERVARGAAVVGEQARLDATPARRAGGAPGGRGASSAPAVDDPDDPGVDQGLAARAGAAGVVAGLERDDGGAAPGAVAGRAQGVDLGVRGPGALVPTLSGERPVGVEDDAADARVGAEPGPFAASASARRMASRCCCSRRPVTADPSCLAGRRAPGWRRRRPRRTPTVSRRAVPRHDSDGAVDAVDCGASVAAWSSHPDFHRRSRNFTWSTGRWMRSGRGL